MKWRSEVDVFRERMEMDAEESAGTVVNKDSRNVS
jgi:hypothetical protein